MKLDRRWLLGAVGLGVAFLLAEIALFIADPWLGGGLWLYDADLGYRMRPGKAGSNRLGFNDRDHDLARTPGCCRILIVGDSFGWFGGRAGNYTAILQQQLDQRFGSNRVELINTGYPGAGPREYLAILKKYGLPYQPDLVLLTFYVGNDYAEADPSIRRIAFAGDAVLVDAQAYRTCWNRALMPSSRLFHAGRHFFWDLTESRRLRREIGDGAAKLRRINTASTPSALGAAMAKLDYCERARFQNGVWADQEREAVRLVVAVRDELRARGIGLQVALLPCESQVSPTLFDLLVKVYGLRAADYDLGLPQKVLRGHLEREGIPYVDLLKDFRREATKGPLYLWNNTHWNAEGNRLAAQCLLPVLSAEAEQRLSAAP